MRPGLPLLNDLKIGFILTFFVIPSMNISAKTEIDTDIYQPPTSSGHCELLIERREQRLDTKQKLKSLLERNTRLFRSVPLAKKSVKRKLEFNRSEIKFKLKQNLYQIQTVEENIIRKGCPGILSITTG